MLSTWSVTCIHGNETADKLSQNYSSIPFAGLEFQVIFLRIQSLRILEKAVFKLA